MSFDPVSALLNVGGKLIDRIFPDPAAKAAAQIELLKLQQAGELQEIAGQLNINAIEAANPKLFVSGWRPAVGWVCVAGLAIQFVVGPVFTFGATLLGRPQAFPNLDISVLLPLLGTLLGVSGLRTFEKLNAVASR